PGRHPLPKGVFAIVPRDRREDIPDRGFWLPFRSILHRARKDKRVAARAKLLPPSRRDSAGQDHGLDCRFRILLLRSVPPVNIGLARNRSPFRWSRTPRQGPTTNSGFGAEVAEARVRPSAAPEGPSPAPRRGSARRRHVGSNSPLR